MKKILAVLVMILFGFIMLINYNNQFYTAAQSHKQLAPLTNYFRLSKKERLNIPKAKPEADIFSGTVVDMENLKINQPVLDDHFLIFHKMIGDTAYFIEKSVGEAMIDPNHKIWRLKDDHFEEVIDIERLNIYQSELFLNDYAIVNDDVYLSYSDMDRNHFYIYHHSDQGSQLIHKGIYRHIYNSSNVPLLIQKDDKVYFTSFEKNLDRYVLTFNCIENRAIQSKMMKSYDDNIDPYEVPIIRLLDLDDEFIVLSSVQSNVEDWENNVDKLRSERDILILNHDFTLAERVHDKDHAFVIPEGIVSFSSDTFHIRTKEYPTSRYFENINDFYNHLKSEHVKVYKTINEVGFFDEYSILAKSITHLEENYPDTASKVDHYTLFFTEQKSVVGVKREYENRNIELVKLHLE